MTLNDVKINPSSLQFDAVPLLEEKLRVNVSCFNFSAYMRHFVNIWIEMNVNISNELN